ncbi:MAG: hypothetical protein M5U09_19060 [Gammaproteobacteria bacterium]|nr:hypothetical protein [Gammaproteobacteria bacterium]
MSDEAAPARLWYLDGQTWRNTTLESNGPYHRAGKLPAAALTGPVAHYAVTIGEGDQVRTWPDNLSGTPDQLGRPLPPTVVFDAAKLKPDQVPEPHGVDSRLTLADGALQFTAAGFLTTGSTASGVRFGCGSAKVQQPVVLVRARATAPATNSFELGLVLDDGRAYGFDVPVGPEWSTVRLPAAQLCRFGRPGAGCSRRTSCGSFRWSFGTWL